jgi:hypothetical protein
MEEVLVGNATPVNSGIHKIGLEPQINACDAPYVPPPGKNDDRLTKGVVSQDRGSS